MFEKKVLTKNFDRQRGYLSGYGNLVDPEREYKTEFFVFLLKSQQFPQIQVFIFLLVKLYYDYRKKELWFYLFSQFLNVWNTIRGFSKKNSVYLKNSQPQRFFCLFFCFAGFFKIILLSRCWDDKSANRFLSEEKYTVVYLMFGDRPCLVLRAMQCHKTSNALFTAPVERLPKESSKSEEMQGAITWLERGRKCQQR